MNADAGIDAGVYADGSVGAEARGSGSGSGAGPGSCRCAAAGRVMGAAGSCRGWAILRRRPLGCGDAGEAGSVVLASMITWPRTPGGRSFAQLACGAV
ncbi:hypothetical protein ACIQCJ_00505 [Streptomyces sp. NPDC093221]|uniref:hypothetical protein n=1 Tax=Streptomyces sp. NPDC093221 TaxID=3366032 RepID=UPI0038291C47